MGTTTVYENNQIIVTFRINNIPLIATLLSLMQYKIIQPLSRSGQMRLLTPKFVPLDGQLSKQIRLLDASILYTAGFFLRIRRMVALTNRYILITSSHLCLDCLIKKIIFDSDYLTCSTYFSENNDCVIKFNSRN